jgi:TRAP-type C4-dicarboxylate transport system substrate-binding protein
VFYPLIVKGVIKIYLFLSIFVSICYAQEKKPKFVIKWATIAPEATTWGDIINKASKEIEKKTNGDIKNIWYFGAVMGDEPDLVRKAKLGQLHGLAVLSVGLSKIAPETIVFSLPYLYNNYKEVDCVLDRAWGMIEKIFTEKGFVPLGRADVGFSVFFSKKEIKNFDDFGKIKFWLWSGVEAVNLAADFYGIKTLVPLSLPDVYTALQTGLIDTVFATYYTCIALQWYNQTQYMTDVEKAGGAYAPAILLLKKDIYDALPEDYKMIIKETVNKYLPELREGLRKDEELAKQALIEKGMKIMEQSPEFIKEVQEKVNELYQKMVGKYYPQWLLNGILQIRNECRASLHK